ncbi:MAG: 30S ribosomal protein S1 [Peptococcaceae bacterium]|nr:30S ribosomal protein S1 [Peptococcaceae bacterium]
MTVRPDGYRLQVDPWERLYQAKERNWTLDAEVVEVDRVNRQGQIWKIQFLDIPDVQGLVPASETGLENEQLMRLFVGQPIRVKVKGLDAESGIAACSRLEVLDEARKQLLAELREGEIIECIVRAVLAPEKDKPARVLLDIGGGVLVEVPRVQAAIWSALPLGRQYVRGQTVKAKITQVDPKTGTVQVSPRDALPDPWETAGYRRGQDVRGYVTGMDSRHIFVEVRPGLIGLANNTGHPLVRPGQKVVCRVKNFNREQRRLHLAYRNMCL